MLIRESYTRWKTNAGKKNARITFGRVLNETLLVFYDELTGY